MINSEIVDTVTSLGGTQLEYYQQSGPLVSISIPLIVL